MQKTIITSSINNVIAHRGNARSPQRASRRLLHRNVRLSAAENDQADQMKAMEEAMKNPEVAARLKAMEEQMANPEVQQQMNEMQSVMSNPAFQQRMAALREDPELKSVFEEIRAGGMGAMMKYMNDPAFLAKIGEKMGDVVPPPAAAPPPAPIEVNNILDAAKVGDLEAIEDFIAIGKAGDRDAEGRGALHYATAYNQIGALKALLSNGFDLTFLDQNGNTALHYAAGYARVDCIKALVGAGIDINVKNKGEQRAIDVVTEEPRNPLNQDADTLALLRG